MVSVEEGQEKARDLGALFTEVSAKENVNVN